MAIEGATTIRATSERRGRSDHPGRFIDERFLRALDIDRDEFARFVGIERARLDDILAARASIDVPQAVRIGRALQLSPERLLRMQNRYDFAVERAKSSDEIALFAPTSRPAFPRSFKRGRLDVVDRRLAFVSYRPVASDAPPDVRVLAPGDWLRVYDGAFEGPEVVWADRIVEDIDGSLYVPFVRRDVANAWFERRLPADLAVPDERA